MLVVKDFLSLDLNKKSLTGYEAPQLSVHSHECRGNSQGDSLDQLRSKCEIQPWKLWIVQCAHFFLCSVLSLVFLQKLFSVISLL